MKTLVAALLGCQLHNTQSCWVQPAHVRHRLRLMLSEQVQDCLVHYLNKDANNWLRFTTECTCTLIIALCMTLGRLFFRFKWLRLCSLCIWIKSTGLTTLFGHATFLRESAFWPTLFLCRQSSRIRPLLTLSGRARYLWVIALLSAIKARLASEGAAPLK